MNSQKRRIVLREKRKPGNYRFLSAEIMDNGDLVFEGQDLGYGVEAAFGCSECEWSGTIKAPDIQKLQDALGGKGSILTLLEDHFGNEKTAGLYAFMQENIIPFESWSRIGD